MDHVSGWETRFVDFFKGIVGRLITAVLPIILALGLFGFVVHALVAAGLHDVSIVQIAWMGTAISPNDEWLQLHNNSGSAIDLSGWTLSSADGTPTINLSGVIPAGGYFLLEAVNDDSVPQVPADMIYSGVLSNAGEDLRLFDDSAQLVDRVDASGGWLSGHADGRVPMTRTLFTADGSLPSSWTHSPRCGRPENSNGVFYACTLTTTIVGQNLTVTPLFNPRFITATATTTDVVPMEAALLGLIGDAQTSIDVAIYGLNRQSVVDALIAAHNGGVIVRVIGDNEAAADDYAAAYQALIDAGISLITDSGSAIEHNKFFVIDGMIVWTGSTNLTDTGFTLNANNSTIITDTTLADVYTIEFNEMWAGNFQKNKTDNTPHLFDYNGTALESYFSPTDLPAFAVWDALAKTEETVHAAMFFWTDDVLTERTIERIQDGVEVFAVWDQLGAGNAYSADEDLCRAGARVKIENFPGKLHHKFAVLDVNGTNPAVVFGSYNWTDSGAYDNDENTLIVYDAALAQAYYAEWQRMYDAIPNDRLCHSQFVYLPMMLKE